MNVAPKNTQSVILIGLKPDGASADLLRPLDRHRCVVEVFGDVYRALARIGRSEPALVVVAVDWLFSSAFEFFTLMRSSHPEVPVLVTGPERAAAKINRALELGAHGIATPEGLHNHLATRSGPIVDAPRHDSLDDDFDGALDDGLIADVQCQRTAPPHVRKTAGTLASTGNVFDAELDRRLREQLAEAESSAQNLADIACVHDEEIELAEAVEHAASPDGEEHDGETDQTDVRAVRVPWLPQGGRPQRTPPQRSAPPVSAAPQRAAETPSSRPLEPQGQAKPSPAPEPEAAAPEPQDTEELPLLTPEELRALFADDNTVDVEDSGMR